MKRPQYLLKNLDFPFIHVFNNICYELVLSWKLKYTLFINHLWVESRRLDIIYYNGNWAGACRERGVIH